MKLGMLVLVLLWEPLIEIIPFQLMMGVRGCWELGSFKWSKCFCFECQFNFKCCLWGSCDNKLRERRSPISEKSNITPPYSDKGVTTGNIKHIPRQVGGPPDINEWATAGLTSRPCHCTQNYKSSDLYLLTIKLPTTLLQPYSPQSQSY